MMSATGADPKARVAAITGEFVPAASAYIAVADTFINYENDKATVAGKQATVEAGAAHTTLSGARRGMPPSWMLFRMADHAQRHEARA